MLFVLFDFKVWSCASNCDIIFSSQTKKDKKALANVSVNSPNTFILIQSILALLHSWVVNQILDQSLLFIAQLPEYTQALQRGREIRNRLIQLFLKETELEQEHYGRALRLPNTSHPDVVRMHAHTLYRASGGSFSVKCILFKVSVVQTSSSCSLYPLSASWRREPGEGGGAGRTETRWLMWSMLVLIVIRSHWSHNRLSLSLSAVEFDFKPRGHVELGEELGLIRQRWGWHWLLVVSTCSTWFSTCSLLYSLVYYRTFSSYDWEKTGEESMFFC